MRSTPFLFLQATSNFVLSWPTIIAMTVVIVDSSARCRDDRILHQASGSGVLDQFEYADCFIGKLSSEA